MIQKIIFCMFLFLGNMHGQSFHYYGFDTLKSYHPSDIIQLQNEQLAILGEVNNSAPFVENLIFEQYMVIADRQGDTVWTKSSPHGTYGGTNIFEKNNGSGFIVWGNTGENYMCGFIGVWLPFNDYYQRSYDNTGNIVSENVYSDNCENRVYDFIKTPNLMGGIVGSEGLGIFDTVAYVIKKIDANENIYSYPLNISGNINQLVKADDGYWAFNATDSSLLRLNEYGILQWQTTIPINYCKDFCRVGNDSLLFVGGTMITKTDSIGIVAWQRSYQIQTEHILHHSNGYYVLTGQRNGNLSILVLNTEGDSLYSREYTQFSSPYFKKTIELSDGAIATLTNKMYTTPSGANMNQYVVIIDTIPFSIVNTTVIENEKGLNITVFPNPSRDCFYISGLEELLEGHFICFNSLGQAVERKLINSNQEIIDASNWSAGVYYYQIISQNGITAKSGKIEIRK